MALVLFALACLILNAQSDDPPSAAAREQMVVLIHQYAANYYVPDFAFDRKLVSFEAPVRSDQRVPYHWSRFGASCTNR